VARPVGDRDPIRESTTTGATTATNCSTGGQIAAEDPGGRPRRAANKPRISGAARTLGLGLHPVTREAGVSKDSSEAPAG
jgi:hypothetical protein